MPERNFKPLNAVRRLVYPAAFWCVLSVMSALSAPQAQAQYAQLPQCPATLEEARAAGYTNIEANAYSSPVIQDLSRKCIYFESGGLQADLPYKAGKLEGTAKSYYESGALERESPYKADKLEGTTKRYSESGALETEVQYKADKQEGREIIYREDGKLFISIIYVDDSPISGLCHQSDGKTVNLTSAELSNLENGLEIECE